MTKNTGISIVDIAKAAGVSHSTVSRALSDSPLVKAATKARIQQLAREMGYSPDAWARSLVMGRTRIIGVVVTTIADPFIAEVVQGIESTAYKHGYTIILATSDSDPAREIAAVEMLQSKRVDGVIVTSSRVGSLYLDHLERIGAPVVLLNNHCEQSGRYTFSVTVDNQHGGYLATQHLIQLGHRRIAHITGPAGHSPSEERLDGYRQALIEAGLTFDPALVVPGTGRTEAGEQGLAALMASDQPPTAVFCYNDVTAIGLLHAAQKSGLLIPRHLSVVGFDDILFASFVHPSLTTIAQPKFEMGQQAMQMALALMTAKTTTGAEVSDIVVKGQLIVRESSGPLCKPANLSASISTFQEENMETMQALVFRDIGKIEFDEIPIPQVTQPDDVLLRVAAVGICGSDLKILEGKHHFKKDTVLGHEFCGEVVEVGSHVHYVKVGDRVAVDNNIRCGFCSFCRMGLSSQCVEIKTSALGVMRDGGYAQYCLVPEKQCFVLPDEIDDILGTQIETLATVVNGMNTLLMLPYDYVLILGFGPIGYLFAQFAKNIAAKVAVTEIDPFRIGVAKECGLTVWNPNEDDVVAKITEFTYGRKADIVIEATGNALETALKCVTPGGKVLPFGMDSSIHTTVVPNDITRWATKILGLYLGQNTMVPSIRIFQENRLNMKPFFTKVIPLQQGIDAFDDLGLDLTTLTHHSKRAMKIVMKM